MNGFFSGDNLKLFGMVVAITIVAQLFSIPLSSALAARGLPR